MTDRPSDRIASAIEKAGQEIAAALGFLAVAVILSAAAGIFRAELLQFVKATFGE